jgi:cytochrome c-type protein NapC
MRDHVYQEYKKTIHYSNRTGVRASCPDCHVPKEWVHKVIRKVRATNELYHWLSGSIDTVEKFAAKRPALARQVWASMEATASRECRNCHGIDSMIPGAQAAIAGKMHELAQRWGETCIVCHKGIAHTLPEGFDRKAVQNALHERMEEEKIDCRQCHSGMAAPPSGEGWK